MRNRVASLILSPVRFQHRVNDPLPPSFLLPPSLILSSSLLPRTRIPSKNKRVPMWRGFCNQRPVGGAKRGNSSRRCFYKAVARLASVSPARSQKGGKKRVGDGTRSQTARKSPRGHRIPTLLNWSTRPKGLTIEIHAPRPSSPSKQSIRLCLQTRNLSDTSSVSIDSSEKDKRLNFPPFFSQDRANIKSFGWSSVCTLLRRFRFAASSNLSFLSFRATEVWQTLKTELVSRIKQTNEVLGKK